MSLAVDEEVPRRVVLDVATLRIDGGRVVERWVEFVHHDERLVVVRTKATAVGGWCRRVVASRPDDDDRRQTHRQLSRLFSRRAGLVHVRARCERSEDVARRQTLGRAGAIRKALCCRDLE